MEATRIYRVETFTQGTRAWAVLGIRGTLDAAVELMAEYDNDDGIVRIVEVTERVLEL